MAGTAIVSPGVLGVALVIVLVGTGILTSIVKKKYEYTPEREKELFLTVPKDGGSSKPDSRNGGV